MSKRTAPEGVGAAAGDGSRPRRVRRAEVRRRQVRRQRRLTAGVVVLMWVAFCAWSLVSAREHLIASQARLPVAQQALSEADLDLAISAVQDANTDLETAHRRLRHPLLAPLRVLPFAGADVRAVTATAEVGATVTAGGLATVEALNALPNGLASLGPTDGAFPLAAIESLAGPLRTTADTTARGVRQLRATPASGRVTQVVDAQRQALRLLEDLAPSIDAAASLAEHLPAFLGGEGPRTYLVGASTPSEARSTGGLIGAVALLRFDDGVPEIGTFRATDVLPVLPPEELPPVNGDAVWTRYGGTGSWLNLNRTPDFATAAVAFERLWTAVDGAPVEGMVVVDPFALAGLLELTGPIDVPGLATLDADTVVDYVANQAYSDFDDDDERKAVLGAVSAAALGQFLTGGDTLDPQRTISVLANLTAGGHLRLHARDPQVQEAFALTPLAGQMPDEPGDFVSVTTYNGAANKADFYADRELDLEVSLLVNRSSRARLRVTLANHAPTSGQPTYVIGPNSPGLDVGDNRSEVSVHLGRNATFGATPEATDAGPSHAETELGRPVHRSWIRLASGESIARDYEWVTPDAWRLDGDDLLYELVVPGQPTIRPTQVRVTLQVPEGLIAVDLPSSATIEGDQIVWRGDIRGETVRLPIRLRPSGAS